MATTYIAKDTVFSDTFESNYIDPLGITQSWIRRLETSTAGEMESSVTVPNSGSRLVIYHASPGILAWGTGNYDTHLRVGATGDIKIDLDHVLVRRVSSDGLTVRATIQTGTSLDQVMSADTTHSNTISDSGGVLDQPTGAQASDHLVLVFRLNSNNTHGGDKIVTIEQNLSTSTRVVAPFTLASPPIIKVDNSTVGLIEQITNYPKLTKDEIMGLNEFVNKKQYRIISDTVGLIESVIQRLLAIKVVDEIVGITESLNKNIYRILSDIVGLSESSSHYIKISISDIIGLTETTSKKIYRIIDDILGITESTGRKFYKIITDITGLIESKNIKLTIVKNEIVSISESVKHTLQTIKGFIQAHFM